MSTWFEINLPLDLDLCFIVILALFNPWWASLYLRTWTEPSPQEDFQFEYLGIVGVCSPSLTPYFDRFCTLDPCRKGRSLFNLLPTTAVEDLWVVLGVLHGLNTCRVSLSCYSALAALRTSAWGLSWPSSNGGWPLLLIVKPGVWKKLAFKLSELYLPSCLRFVLECHYCRSNRAQYNVSKIANIHTTLQNSVHTGLKW